MENKVYSVLRRTVSTVKKSIATMAAACVHRKARQVTDARRGAGRSPLPSSTVRTVVADTDIPSFFSSPWAGSPTRVLPGQPQDQRNHGVGERRTSASRSGLGPFAGHQPAVPPQDRVRGDKEARPAPARKRSAQHRQQRTIGRSELGPLHLAAQHVELMAEDGDLDVLGMLALQAPKQHADESACHEVEEGKGHWLIIPARSCCS
ncbi:MAG TPA: hypothetical protein VFA46_21185, partial [Actinomycetes bacterium]|nr:hypothetical protein [Actinomycetes bacterium]